MSETVRGVAVYVDCSCKRPAAPRRVHPMSGECWSCSGAGTVLRRLTLNEFRALITDAGPVVSEGEER